VAIVVRTNYIGYMTRTNAKTSDFGTQGSAVDKLVLATVNAPYKREISVTILKKCLMKAEPGDWVVHLASFFTDVNPNLIFDFAALHGISKSALAQAYLAVKIKTGELNPDLEAELVQLATVA
jgi:hypothetical protein